MSGLMSVSQQVLSKVVAQVKKKRLPFKVTCHVWSYHNFVYEAGEK